MPRNRWRAGSSGSPALRLLGQRDAFELAALDFGVSPWRGAPASGPMRIASSAASG